MNKCIDVSVVLNLTEDYLDFLFFFFNDTATTEIYTLSLHDALPISPVDERPQARAEPFLRRRLFGLRELAQRSEEHTSELQSPCNLVCRLLLEKKKIEICALFLLSAFIFVILTCIKVCGNYSHTVDL